MHIQSIPGIVSASIWGWTCYLTHWFKNSWFVLGDHCALGGGGLRPRIWSLPAKRMCMHLNMDILTLQSGNKYGQLSMWQVAWLGCRSMPHQCESDQGIASMVGMRTPQQTAAMIKIPSTWHVQTISLWADSWHTPILSSHGILSVSMVHPSTVCQTEYVTGFRMAQLAGGVPGTLALMGNYSHL